MMTMTMTMTMMTRTGQAGRRQRWRNGISSSNEDMKGVARDLARRLIHAANDLLDRLMDHHLYLVLQQGGRGEEGAEGGEGGAGDDVLEGGPDDDGTVAATATATAGITLPVHAVAWLSLQLLHVDDDDDSPYSQNHHHHHQYHPLANFFTCSGGRSETDQRRRRRRRRRRLSSQVQTLLSEKIRHLRITNESSSSSSSSSSPSWPPPLTARGSSRRRRRRALDRRNSYDNFDTADNISSSSSLSSLSLTHRIAALGKSSTRTSTSTSSRGRSRGRSGTAAPPTTSATVTHAAAIRSTEEDDDEIDDEMIWTWLQAYHAWQCRPLIFDLQSLFPNLQVLWLKQVPPEWLVTVSGSSSTSSSNRSILPRSIQLVRLEQCAIFHLEHLFVASSSSSSSSSLPQQQQQQQVPQPQRLQEQSNLHHEQQQEDPLSPPPLPPPPPVTSSRLLYPNLTHIKLLHCSLTDASLVANTDNNNTTASTATAATTTTTTTGLSSLSSSWPPSPSLSRSSLLARYCTNLQVLCLAHNDLTDACAALLGIEQHDGLPFLKHLDLSFNCLTRFQTIVEKSRGRRKRQTAGTRAVTAAAAVATPSSVSCLEYLDLSHNRIVTCNGGILDRASLSHSLRVLKLHNNCLSDMAAIRVLPRLTQLQELTLHSNPLSDANRNRSSKAKDTTSATGATSGGPPRRRPWFPRRRTSTAITATTTAVYRIHVLDLFLNYKAQTGILPLSATLRQWQHALPRLDGQAVSMLELQALRGRTFQHGQQPPPRPQLPFVLQHDSNQATYHHQHHRSTTESSASSSASTLSSSKPAAKPAASSLSAARCRRKRHLALITEPCSNSNIVFMTSTTTAAATAAVAAASTTSSSLSPTRQSLWTDSEQGRTDSISVMSQQPRRTKGSSISRRHGDCSTNSAKEQSPTTRAASISLMSAKSAPPTILMQQQQQVQQLSESEVEPYKVAAKSSMTSAAATTTTTKRRPQRTVNFTTLDVLKSLSTFTEPEIIPDGERPQIETELPSVEQQEEDMAANSYREQESLSELSMKEAPKVVVNGVGSITDNLECTEPPLNGTMVATTEEENATTSSSIPFAAVESSNNGIIVDRTTDTDNVADDIGAATTASANGNVPTSPPPPPPLNLMNESVLVDSINSAFAESPSRASITNIVSTASSPKHRLTNSFGESSLGGASSLSRSLQNAMFPDHVWPDVDNINSSIMHDSVISSSASSSPQHGIKKYQLAEKNSKFVGQHTFKQLLILENLELYFRFFVFCRLSGSGDGLDVSSVSAWDDDIDNWQTVLETYPRIQLYPIDHRIREAAASQVAECAELDPVLQEDFRRVWREHVVACGKPALRRLTPMRATRLGFHGEVVWSSDADGGGPVSPDVFIKCRETIICCSSAAFYIIADHDAVTRRTMQDSNATSSPSKDNSKGSNNSNDKKRKIFPLPIPQHACFAEAVWPHAMARHSFQALRSITIGFGFQRLTLRFSNPTNSQQQQRSREDEDFVYILSTCNKLQTISLLKDIQGIANECRSSNRLRQGGSSSASRSESLGIDDVQIENDDRHVLEALAMAVVPDDTISMVLHYQILEQVWKHGDRGSVRRVCLVTDTKIFLLDEDYHGDGGGGGSGQQTGDKASHDSGRRREERVPGDTVYRLVDKASLEQISIVQAAGADPRAITLVISPLSRLQRTHNWRLLCRDRDGAERLVEDVRKAISLLE
jgi:hypothetical protein